MNGSRISSLVALAAVGALPLAPTAPIHAQSQAEAAAAQFTWREVGPANPAGRIVDVEGVESAPHIIYFGTATGGIWKTVNAGITWDPIFDDQRTSSIGDIGLSRSNPDILYVGTGEANNRNSSPWGVGIYKSTDAGATWTHIGLEETRHIGRVVVHPTNPDIVYVAALGHLWATNEERGVFKTTDGGTTWEKVLYFDERTGVTDLTMDPVDPNILYAAAHERLRDRFDAGDPADQYGPAAGIYVTRNGGGDWTRSTEGLPTVEMGRIGIDAARSAPGTVYAIIGVQGQGGGGGRGGGGNQTPLDPNRDGIFKTTDYGETWTKVNDWNNRPSYYSQIRVDPNDADVIWGFASPMAYSDDGGITVISGPDVQGNTHIDYHGAWIDPNNSDHVIVGGDGGLNVTWDRGAQWEVVQQMGLAQAYAISADMRKPYYLVVGLQDNGVWVGASRGLITRGVTNNDWFALSNADGFQSAVDPEDFNTVYAETQSGSIYRRDLRTGQNRSIRPQPPQVPEGEERERYRFDWNTPFILSPHNSKTLYLGGNKLFKSVDQGNNWSVLSPDLTAQPDESASAIVSVAESPLVADLLWVGTNDGNVYLRRENSTEWNLVSGNIQGIPDGYWMKSISASGDDPGRAYVAIDGHRWNDFDPYIYVTDDYGETWRNLTNDLPEGTAYVVKEDPRNPDLLFTGTETGVFMSINRGESWVRFGTGMPTVPVHDLVIHPRDGDLIAGTHGRGAWIADNITPLQELTLDAMAEDVALLDPRPETKWLTTYEFSWTTDKRFYADNPPTGSTIAYYLRTPAATPVRIEILDLMGDVVRTLDGTGTAGLNTVFWNLSRNPPEGRGGGGGGRGGGGRGGRGGGSADPGEYVVRLTVGDFVGTTRLVVEEHRPGYMGR